MLHIVRQSREMERVRRIHPYPCECGNVSVQRQTFSLRTLTVAVHLENIVSTNLLCVWAFCWGPRRGFGMTLDDGRRVFQLSRSGSDEGKGAPVGYPRRAWCNCTSKFQATAQGPKKCRGPAGQPLEDELDHVELRKLHQVRLPLKL